MRVKVTMTLDIDPEAWMDLYRVERSEIRADVNAWGRHLLTQAAADNGVTPEDTDMDWGPES